MASIQISADRLRATLRIECGEVLDLADVRRLLHEANIHFGVDRAAVEAALVPDAHARELLIAVGTAPQPAQALVVLDDDLTPLPKAVNAGVQIGRLDYGPEVHPGRGVDGDSIACGHMHLGLGIHCDGEQRLFAIWDGIVTIDDVGHVRVDLPGGIPAQIIDHPTIVIAADGLRASLELAPGAFVPRAVLLRALVAAGIMHGNHASALASVGIPEVQARQVELAHGEAGEPGGHDSVEHLIETTSPFAMDRHQRIDFHRQHWVKVVSAGTRLAILHRGRPACPGRLVTGAMYEAQPGTRCDLQKLAGPGTCYRDGAEPDIIATVSGAYARDAQGVVSVRSPLVIAGNVDHHCGDIDARLPVSVRGDVVAGFCVQCTGPTSVGGAIEDARVVIDGDLTVASGILPGIQRVIVHGKLDARHITGRPVRAASITLAMSIMDSDVIAGVDLTCPVVISSRIRVGRTITCDVIGDEAEARTVIELGGDPFLAALAHDATADQRRCTAAATHLRERLEMHHHLLREVLKNDGVDEAGPIGEEIQDYEQQLAITEAAGKRATRIIALYHRGESQRAASLTEASLVVRRRIHAGSEVAIGGHRLAITTTLEGPLRFHLADGAVTWD